MKNLIAFGLLIIFFNSCKQKTKYKNTYKEIASTTEIKSNILLNKTNKCLPSKLRVYLNDPDKSGTNIRNAPKGKVVTQLIIDDLNHDYFLTLTEAKNGWFKIEDPVEGMESNVKIPKGEGWIHGSVISVDTRNYANQHLKLLEKPDNGKVITTIKKEVIGLRLKDICGNWTKVEYKKYVGWIENKWLCGNPLTNCS